VEKVWVPLEYNYIPETASQYVTADKPETTAAFPVSQEIVVESNPNLPSNPNQSPHTSNGMACKC